MSEFYTTSELAALLRVKPRKIYDLVSEEALPVRKVTGKLLFPRAEIAAWLGTAAPDQTPVAVAREAVRFEPPPVATGGHDPLLEWALRESECQIAGLFNGALDGLRRAQEGSSFLAGLHIPEDDGWNVGAVAEKLSDAPWVLVEWAKRRRGLILRPGLAKRPESLKAARGLRFQSRQDDAGSEMVLNRLLAAEKLTKKDLYPVETVERSEIDLAMALADGRADVGLGIEAAARQFKLDFVPLIEERFDLLVWRKAFFDPPFQKLLALCRSEKFAAKASALGGYDISGFGAVHFNGAE